MNGHRGPLSPYAWISLHFLPSSSSSMTEPSTCSQTWQRLWTWIMQRIPACWILATTWPAASPGRRDMTVIAPWALWGDTVRKVHRGHGWKDSPQGGDGDGKAISLKGAAIVFSWINDFIHILGISLYINDSNYLIVKMHQDFYYRR